MKIRYMIAAVLCWLLPMISLVCINENLSKVYILSLSAISYIFLVYVLISLKKLLSSEFNYFNVHIYINANIFIQGIISLNAIARSFSTREYSLTDIIVGTALLSISAIINLIIYFELIHIKINIHNIKGLWLVSCLFGILSGIAGTLIILNIPLTIWLANYLSLFAILHTIFAFSVWTDFISIILMGIVFYRLSPLEKQNTSVRDLRSTGEEKQASE